MWGTGIRRNWVYISLMLQSNAHSQAYSMQHTSLKVRVTYKYVSHSNSNLSSLTFFLIFNLSKETVYKLFLYNQNITKSSPTGNFLICWWLFLSEWESGIKSKRKTRYHFSHLPSSLHESYFTHTVYTYQYVCFYPYNQLKSKLFRKLLNGNSLRLLSIERKIQP